MKNIDHPSIGDNLAINDDDLNDYDESNGYCETPTIDPSYFYGSCVFCENDSAEGGRPLSSDQKFDVDVSKEFGIEESIERERGGGGRSDSGSTIEKKLSSPSTCNCECDLCALRNKYGERPPCRKDGDRIDRIDRYDDIDDEDDPSLDRATCSELSEISQVTTTPVFFFFFFWSITKFAKKYFFSLFFIFILFDYHDIVHLSSFRSTVGSTSCGRHWRD